MRDENLSNYLWAMRNNHTIHSMTKQGFSEKEILGVLAREIETLEQRVSKLDFIAPRKITLLDGTVMVWHCPDNLIPKDRC